MNKKLIIVVLLAVIGNASSQDVDYYRNQAFFNMKSGDVNMAVMYYAQSVDKAKENRNAGKGVRGELLAEYAYALALHHDYEASLINIDRAIMLNAANGKFFAGLVLVTMGYNTAAFQLSGLTPGQYINVPRYSKWIDGLYWNITSAYTEKTKVTINRDSPQEALKRAVDLTERGQTVQAIVLFEELMDKYPNAYNVPASYSTLWEKLGNRVYASTLLKRSIELIGSSDTASRNAFVEHLRTLDEVQPLGLLGQAKNIKTIAYVGASFGKMTSLNGRLGVSTESKWSTSLNGNVMFLDSSSFGNVGLSVYKTWSFFVVGLGVSRQLSKLSNAWGLAPSVGLTFINRSQTASLDFTSSWQIPFSDDKKLSFNLSIGTTFYLDFKREKK